MRDNEVKEKTMPLEESVQPPERKKFQGFSMGFLLILLAVTVGLYMVCTILVSK